MNLDVPLAVVLLYRVAPTPTGSKTTGFPLRLAQCPDKMGKKRLYQFLCKHAETMHG